MAIYKNSVCLRGNMGEDAELKMSNSGQPRLSGTICVNHAYKEKSEGNEDKWKTISTWVKWVMWGNLATTMNRVGLKKGNLVELEGELRPDIWVNNNNGEKHNELFLLVTSAQKFERPAKAEGESKNATAQQGSIFGPKASQGYSEAIAQQNDPNNDDDLPF